MVDINELYEYGRYFKASPAKMEEFVKSLPADYWH